MPLESDRDFDLVMGTTDFGRKVEMTRAFAHERLANRDAFKLLDNYLTILDSDVRPERNRIIHDLWVGREGKRTQYKPRYTKKPHESRQMHTTSETKMKADDIRDFAAIIVTLGSQFTMAKAYLSGEKEGEPQPWRDIFYEPLEMLRQYQDRNSTILESPPESSQE